MPLLEPQYIGGRDTLDSHIQLNARWLKGWRFKDRKWKFEEESMLPHAGDAYLTSFCPILGVEPAIASRR